MTAAAGSAHRLTYLEVHWLSSHHRPLNECGLHGQLGGSEIKSLTRQLFRHSLNFIQHATRLDLRHPILDVALTLTLPDFQRLTGKVNYNAIIEFQRWFNNNFAELVEQFIPHTADFLGINFVIESHMLERHKMEYKQGDVHVDIFDRQAFSQEPLFLGTIRSEIT